MEWAAAPGVAGPFHLLRRELAPGQSVADLDLPLDPGVGRWLEDVTSPLVLSRGVEASGEPGLRVYQVVSEDGACSQFAYLLVRRDAIGSPGEGQQLALALPWRGGVRTAAGLFDEIPGLRSFLVAGPFMGDGPQYRIIVRGLDGRPLRADEWIAPGAGVFLLGPDLGEVVVVGAAEPSPRPLPAAGCRTGNRNRTTLSPRYGQPPVTGYEALCGEEGVDWSDANGDGIPDECPGPLLTPPPPASSSHGRLTISTWDSEGGWSSVAALFSGGRLFFHGIIGSAVLEPTTAFLAEAGKDPAERDYPPVDWLPEDLAVAPACRCADTDGDGTDDCTEILIGTDPLDPLSRGPDHDRDGVPDDLDVCPGVFDPLQVDADGDGLGDACDPCPDGDPACEDPDGDGLLTPFDNCPHLAGLANVDSDGDGIGDDCDNCPDFFWPSESDLDGDGVGDACDCMPDEPSAWAEPAPAADLRLGHAQVAPGAGLATLSWEDSRPAFGPGTRWSVARGGIDALWRLGLAASAECWEPARDEPNAVDPEAGSWWYLVRAFNACGAASWGTPGRNSPLDGDEPCP